MMKQRQQGVALITAVLIVALVTAAAVAMAARQQVDIRRSSNILSNDQAYLFALGAEDYARNVLEWDGDRIKGNPDVDHLGEAWAQTVSVPVEGAMLNGSVQDLQGRFNLNALLDANGQPNQVMIERFKNLLRLLGLDENIAEAVVDWIDADNNPRPGFGGAEEDFYLLQAPPYRAANTLMTSASELRLIRGMDDEAYQTLIPFVSALPASDTAINVNTAPAEVLAALEQNLTLQIGKELVEAREADEFATIAEFTGHNLLANHQIDPNMVDVKSNFFRVDAVAKFDQAVARLHSLLKRDSGKVEVLMRSRGVF